MVGCESGVELHDALTASMGFSGNGKELTQARRNKYIMGERIRACGLRAVKQLLTSEWSEVEGFINAFNTKRFRVVLKPVDSAGTDSVFFADNIPEAKEAFNTILGRSSVFGAKNKAVLVQEYLQGTEYVVDSVSLDGEHKVVAMWQYDKRRTNDAQFVYYGLRLFESTRRDPERNLENRLANYAFSVLDALEIKNGPSHAEIMWLDEEDAPCLVEVGARPHGGEGTFVDIAEAPIGYNQLSVGLDALKDPVSFKALSVIPPPLKAFAAEVCLVSLQEGKIVGHGAGLETIKAMPSFKSVEFHTPIGGKLHKTIDIFTSPGSVLLGHTDCDVLEADYARIHVIENEDLFIIDEPVALSGSGLSPVASSSSSSRSVDTSGTTTSEDEEEDGFAEELALSQGV